MLTNRQIELVGQSWDAILHSPHETGIIFYQKLFELDPELRHFFKEDIRIQAQKLIDMITFIVHKLNNLDEIIADVKSLGLKHKQILIRPEHYDTVAKSLLWTLEKALGPHYSKEVEEAWSSVYKMLARIMIEGSKDSPIL